VLPGVKYALLYTPQSRPPADDYHWSMISDIKDGSYKLGGQSFTLVSGHKYTIKVKAVSKFGLESFASNVVVVEAADHAPEKIPPPRVTFTGKFLRFFLQSLRFLRNFEIFEKFCDF